MSDTEQFDFGKKKSKKSKKTAKEIPIEDSSSSSFVRGPVYSYESLLSRVRDMIEEKTPDLGKRSAITLRPPQVVRVGSKKVAFVNFADTCNSLGRTQDHVFQFFIAELGTTGSITSDQALVLKGPYNTKHIESLLRKYISEYVQCHMCKSAKTVFNRDAAARLSQISCLNCGASRTVHAIKSGFHATTKADRKAERAAN
jgi:translation initiation factor 2 subunit 2